MPWMESTAMSQRHEFVVLARSDGANFRELCRRFGISPVTGYKWAGRFGEGGSAWLADRSRRPAHSPTQTPPHIEQLVVSMRKEHPAWGGRKIRARLLALGHRELPAASTITGILRRHGLINPDGHKSQGAFIRFEWPRPNDLWQMDFKGDFALSRGRCHPLTILDDHSRFNLALRACADQRGLTARAVLTEAFGRYGLPWRMLCDNGPPWGTSRRGGLTHLGAWLIRLGITVSHGRAFHPQTQGKDERFHRSLKVELLKGRSFGDLDETQRGV